MIELKLYISSRSPTSDETIEKLKSALNRTVGAEYRMNVISLWETPHAAEKDNVFVTPTVIKKQPPPEKRVVGDLHEVDKVLAGLRLSA